jgi:hypothetical protein
MVLRVNFIGNRMPYSDRKIRLKYQRDRRNKLREKGVCTRCGGPRDDVFMDCSCCRQKSNTLVKKIIKRNLKLGLCQCGQTRLEAKLVCKRCSDTSKRRQRELKQQVIVGYGGKCACCEQTIFEFLSVDHVNGDGAAKRRKLGKSETSTTLYRRLIKENFPDEYQILCFNCNMSLGFYGYCPHHPRIRRSTDKHYIKAAS